jgi:hypothetical protein
VSEFTENDISLEEQQHHQEHQKWIIYSDTEEWFCQKGKQNFCITFFKKINF